MLKFYIIHVFEYTLLGVFASGMVIWIYHAMFVGDSAIEWNYAFAAGMIFGVFFTYRHRHDYHPDHPH